jgi:hypothetical protein
MTRTWIGAAATAAITFGTAGYAVALDKQPSSSQPMLQKDRDPPPGDAQTPDKRGERAMTAAPQNSPQNSNGEVGPSMGENQKPKGMVGP